MFFNWRKRLNIRKTCWCLAGWGGSGSVFVQQGLHSLLGVTLQTDNMSHTHIFNGLHIYIFNGISYKTCRYLQQRYISHSRNTSKIQDHVAYCTINKFFTPIFTNWTNFLHDYTNGTWTAVDHVYRLRVVVCDCMILTFSFPDCLSIASYPTFPIITGITAWAFLRTFTHKNNTQNFNYINTRRMAKNFFYTLLIHILTLEHAKFEPILVYKKKNFKHHTHIFVLA